MTSSQLRDEKRSRVSALLPAAARARIIAISGTTPDPPATSSSGPPCVGLPDEVAADRPAELDLVARPQLVGQVRGDLAVVEALHRQLDVLAVRGRRDRVAALRLVAVVRGQANVDVLAGAVSRPAVDVEGDRLDARRLSADLDDRRDLPGQSPQYRCSRHGSP